MPELCSWCGKPLSLGVRFCEECGGPAGGKGENIAHSYIPLLELHTGLLGAGRSAVVMQVSTDELLIFSLPDFFVDSVEEFRERLDSAWMKVSDAGGDWKKTIETWKWDSEYVITGLEEIRDDLLQDGKSVVVIKTTDIRSVFIERIISDTVWDMMTVDAAGKKYIIDLLGPLAWYTFTVLKETLGDRVEYQED